MFIQIYGKSMCQNCIDLCDVLDMYHIDYEYYNVEYMSLEEVNEILTTVAKGVKELPIIIIDKNRYVTIDEFKTTIRSQIDDQSRVG